MGTCFCVLVGGGGDFLFVELFRKQLERHATLIERGNIEIVRKAEN